MSDGDSERRILSRKELARKRRRAAYQQAKERRATDPRYLAQKEAARQQRRAAYQQEKERRKAAAAAEKARVKDARSERRSECRSEAGTEQRTEPGAEPRRAKPYRSLGGPSAKPEKGAVEGENGELVAELEQLGGWMVKGSSAPN